jgi:transcriptional pleiotropic regulator of transition state genes
MDSGIARRIDDLGRVVIPAETRRLFNIKEGDQLLITVEGAGIVIRKLESTCTFCGSNEQVTAFKGKGICAVCRGQLTRSGVEAPPRPPTEPRKNGGL